MYALQKRNFLYVRHKAFGCNYDPKEIEFKGHLYNIIIRSAHLVYTGIQALSVEWCDLEI